MLGEQQFTELPGGQLKLDYEHSRLYHCSFHHRFKSMSSSQVIFIYIVSSLISLKGLCNLYDIQQSLFLGLSVSSLENILIIAQSVVFIGHGKEHIFCKTI